MKATKIINVNLVVNHFLATKIKMQNYTEGNQNAHASNAIHD